MRGRTFGLIGLMVLSVAGCGKHSGSDKQAASSTADQTSTSPAAAAQSAPVSVAAASGCTSSAPDKATLARSIDAGMLQIYGADEAGARFNVQKITTSDCSHLIVTYSSAGSGAAPQTAPVTYGDDGQWHITLFNKQYPVH